MKANARILIVFTLSLLGWTAAQGQNVPATATPVKREAYIETTDGRIFKGVFLRGDATTIEIETDGGVQSLKIEKIDNIRFIRLRLTYAAGTPGADTTVYRSPGSPFYHSSLSCPIATPTAKPVPLVEAARVAHPCAQCDPPTLKAAATVTASGVNDLPSAGGFQSSPSSQSSVSSGGNRGDGQRVRTSNSGGSKASRGGQSGYILGPRGGCYYINRNGNKTYVSRSLCR